MQHPMQQLVDRFQAMNVGSDFDDPNSEFIQAYGRRAEMLPAPLLPNQADWKHKLLD
jgi:hypothetical protein